MLDQKPYTHLEDTKTFPKIYICQYVACLNKAVEGSLIIILLYIFTKENPLLIFYSRTIYYTLGKWSAVWFVLMCRWFLESFTSLALLFHTVSTEKSKKSWKFVWEKKVQIFSKTKSYNPIMLYIDELVLGSRMFRAEKIFNYIALKYEIHQKTYFHISPWKKNFNLICWTKNDAHM